MLVRDAGLYPIVAITFTVRRERGASRCDTEIPEKWIWKLLSLGTH